MNLQSFWVTLALGTLTALLLSWRFSRKGIHPRFRPPVGVVVMVFLALMGMVGFLAFMIGHMVGNQIPSVRGATGSAAAREEAAPATTETNKPQNSASQ